jgi:dTDP-4-amino-4,6-dideoxygalactose transaminase
VPLFDTATPLAPLMDDVRERIGQVLERGVFVLGEQVKGFEQELAAYLGARHVIGVANGTDAITIAARALGVGPGDDVVVPSFTFYATVEALVTAGANPVFCDVDEQTRNVSVDTVKAAITPNTKLVVAVDLFGCPAPVPELRELGLPVLEDAAQALGASLGGRRAGTLGDAATISFYPSKNLGALGDGGAIVTDDDEVAELARALRFHGSRDKRSFQYVGYNSRLDELQAAALRVLLPRLDRWCQGRLRAARAYGQAGLGEHVQLPHTPEEAIPAWHLFVVEHPRADELQAALLARGIGARGYYRTPIHRQPSMARWQTGPELPVTDQLAASNLALPMSPVLSADQAREVSDAVAAAVG